MRDGGVDAISVAERVELRRHRDDELLDVAAAEHRVCVTRDVNTVRPLARELWMTERPIWGVILIAPSVRSGRRSGSYVASELARIASEHPGDDPLQQELWIAAPRR